MRDRACGSLFSLLMLVACSACGSAEQTDTSSAAVQQAGADAGPETCSGDELAKFYRAASQVDFNYRPLQGEAMVRAADTIVRGRVRSLAPGRTIDFTSGPSHPMYTTVVTLEVEKVYKGASVSGNLLYIEVARSPLVTAAVLDELGARIPVEPVTVFVSPAAWDHEVHQYTSANIPDGASLDALKTPQGFVVSSRCGNVQPFASEPVFEDDLESAAQLDEKLTSLVTLTR